MRVITSVIILLVALVICTACEEQNNIFTPNYNNEPTSSVNSEELHTRVTNSNHEAILPDSIKNILGEWKSERIFALGKVTKYTDKEIKDLFLGKTVILSIDSMKLGEEETLKPIYYRVSEHLKLHNQISNYEYLDLPAIDNDTLKLITMHKYDEEQEGIQGNGGSTSSKSNRFTRQKGEMNRCFMNNLSSN